MNAERFEGHVQVLILITVAGMAGAGSFTHVHDWTMSVVPAHTGSWLGWVNAVITELVPAAAGIEIRRRKRQHRRVTYPMTILATDVIISIGVQLSDAKHNLGGSLAFALPALAFLALTKLVLARVCTDPQKEETACAAQPASASHAISPSGAPGAAAPTPVPATATTTTSTTRTTQRTRSSSPAAPVLTASPTDRSLQPVPPAQLLISARMAAFSHQQQAGTPITPDELATRMGIPPALAESLLDHLNGTQPVTAVNGTAWNGSRP